jgi:serralysin
MKKYLLIIVLFLAIITKTKAQWLNTPGCTADMHYTMFKSIDTATRGVADNYLTWENGTTILVKFLPGGSKDLRNRIINTAKQWETYANIKFKFLPDTASFTNLRVKLGKGGGHNSLVGTQCSSIPQDEQTINFDTLSLADQGYYRATLAKKAIELTSWDQVESEMKTDPYHWSLVEIGRVVTHEFGHSLGLLHEQSFPGVIKWNKSDSVYNYYAATQKWPRWKVDFNVFEVNKQTYTNGTAYDPKSIMHYDVKPWQTLDGYTLKASKVLSEGDKAMIAALYPKNKLKSDIVVPKVTVTKFIKVEVVNNKAKGGLSIYPSFELTTNGKLGQVYFIAQLTDEKGNFFPISRDFYNFSGTVATYLEANLKANTKVNYNKGVKNLELFLPFDMIPDLKGEKVKVYFSVYQNDAPNDVMFKQLYFSNTSPLSVTK